MKEYFLDPIQYDTRKSFYKKAVVGTTTDGRTTYLRSYDTIVAEIDNINDTVTVNGWYSQTTARHINEFLSQYGFKTLNKKQMKNEYLFPMDKSGNTVETNRPEPPPQYTQPKEPIDAYDVFAV